MTYDDLLQTIGLSCTRWEDGCTLADIQNHYIWSSREKGKDIKRLYDALEFLVKSGEVDKFESDGVGRYRIGPDCLPSQRRREAEMLIRDAIGDVSTEAGISWYGIEHSLRYPLLVQQLVAQMMGFNLQAISMNQKAHLLEVWQKAFVLAKRESAYED